MTRSDLRRELGSQSAISVQANRLGPFDLVVSRSYIGGQASPPQDWQREEAVGRVVVRSTPDVQMAPDTALAISDAIDWLEDDLGFDPLVAQVEWHFVPKNSDVFEVRKSFALRGHATMMFWEPANRDGATDSTRAVRSVAHELTHLQTALRGIQIDAEADERLAYLVEHCAVLQVFGEVHRLPLARLHGGKPTEIRGLERSVDAQRDVSLDLPPRVLLGTADAERLLTRCRTSVREAGIVL